MFIQSQGLDQTIKHESQTESCFISLGSFKIKVPSLQSFTSSFGSCWMQHFQRKRFTVFKSMLANSYREKESISYFLHEENVGGRVPVRDWRRHVWMVWSRIMRYFRTLYIHLFTFLTGNWSCYLWSLQTHQTIDKNELQQFLHSFQFSAQILNLQHVELQTS